MLQRTFGWLPYQPHQPHESSTPLPFRNLVTLQTLGNSTLMDIPVRLPGMEGQNVALRTAGTFTGAKLMLNGQPVAKQNGLFQLRSNAGSTMAVKFKNRFLDPIPNLEVGGQTIQLVPALQWYQYVWMGLPLLLVFGGGAIGGFCGGVATVSSSRVFRSDLSDGMKYGLTGLISAAGFLAYIVIAGTIMAALKH
jgi:hypothetical protein